MAQDFCLASAGDDIKIWDAKEFSLIKNYNPHAGNISSLSWAHDNTCLASASSVGDKISLNYLHSPTFSFDIATEEERTCIAYNSMSRYIMGGGNNGLIHIWDLKTRKLKKTYKDHKAAVTSMQFNSNDTMIASASEAGEIIIFSVVTGIGYSPLVVPKAQAIRQIQYSHFKKSLLASASDDGSVVLWDTSSKRLLHSFPSAHKAPAMGLVFSPLNEMLMMSCGLDKKIVCYDVVGKSAVKTMVAESPLTSIDVMHDGSTLAVGSTRGKIYIYDLRHGATPIKVLKAHKSSVQSLKFMHKSPTSEIEGGTVKSTVTGTKRADPHQFTNNINNNNVIPTQAGEIQSTPQANRAADRGTLDNAHRDIDPYHSQQEANNSAKTYNYLPSRDLSSEAHIDVFSPVREGVFSPLTGNVNVSGHVMSNGPSPLAGVTRGTDAGFTQNEQRIYGLDDARLKPRSDDNSQNSSYTSSSRDGDYDHQGSAAVSDLPERDYEVPHRYGDETNHYDGRPLHYDDRAESDEGRPRSGEGFNQESRPYELSTQKTTAALQDRLQQVFNQQTSSQSAYLPNGQETRFSEPREPQRGTLFSSEPREPQRETHFSSEPKRESSLTRAHTSSSSHIQSSIPDSQPLSSLAAPGALPTGSLPAPGALPAGSLPAPGALPAGSQASLGEGAVSGSATLSEGAVGGGAASLQPFHTQFIRNVVQDALEDFRDQIRQDVLNLHMEVIKQFVVQQAEMERMMKQHSINEELLAEVERLKEENRRLKKNF